MLSVEAADIEVPAQLLLSQLGIISNVLRILGITPVVPLRPRLSRMHQFAMLVLLVVVSGIWLVLFFYAQPSIATAAVAVVLSVVVPANYVFLTRFFRRGGLRKYLPELKDVAVVKKSIRVFKVCGFLLVASTFAAPITCATMLSSIDHEHFPVKVKVGLGVPLAGLTMFWTSSLLVFFALYICILHVISCQWAQLAKNIRADKLSSAAVLLEHGVLARRVQSVNKQFGKLAVPYTATFSLTVFAMLYDITNQDMDVGTKEGATALAFRSIFLLFSFIFLNVLLIPAGLVSRLGSPNIIKAVSQLCSRMAKPVPAALSAPSTTPRTAPSGAAQPESNGLQHASCEDSISKSSDDIAPAWQQRVSWTEDEATYVSQYLQATNTCFQMFGVDITLSLVAKLYYSLASLILVLLRVSSTGAPTTETVSEEQ